MRGFGLAGQAGRGGGKISELSFLCCADASEKQIFASLAAGSTFIGMKMHQKSLLLPIPPPQALLPGI